MNDRIKAELEKEEPTDFHREMLSLCKNLIKRSRTDMGQFYSDWDARHETYRARKVPDKRDARQAQMKEPSKLVVPMSYAQIDTFIAFCLMMMTQRKYLFEFDATGQEDFKLIECSEMLLDRDMRNAKQNHLLYQFLLDVAKFSLGVIKCTWAEEFTYIPTEVEDEPAVVVLGQEVQAATKKVIWKKVPTWKGNKLFNVSPYRVYPDTRLPLTRYQEGEFCGCEEDVTKSQLKKEAAFGKYAGIDHIGPIGTEDMDIRGKTREVSMMMDNKNTNNVILTEVYVDIIPSDKKFVLEDGKPLADQKFPVRYVVTYANDNKIIRCEPYGYISKNFPLYIAQFSPDMHELVNHSLAEVIGRLQEVVDWFFNSRVASVVRTLDNQLVIDPTGIEMSTVNSRSRVILMKKSAARTGPERYIKQLGVTDVTARHMDDVGTVAGMMPTVTGVNENAMGQYSGGRRSAYESRVVTQGSAARMKKVVSLLWEGAIAPMAQAMLTNHRQGSDFEMFKTVCGDDVTEELFMEFKQTPEKLAQSNDLLVFDGTLPSEKMFMAQSLQEILTVVMTNPDAATRFNLDPKLILEEMFALRGVTKLKRFEFSQQELMMQQLQTMLANGQLGQQAGSDSSAGASAGAAGV